MFIFQILNITALLFPRYVSFFLRMKVSMRVDFFYIATFCMWVNLINLPKHFITAIHGKDLKL